MVSWISGPTLGAQSSRTQSIRALDQLSTGLDHLVKLVEDGGLDHFDDPGLVGFLQSFEKVRNRLSLVDHVSIAAVEAAGSAADAVPRFDPAGVDLGVADLQSRSGPAGPGRRRGRPPSLDGGGAADTGAAVSGGRATRR